MASKPHLLVGPLADLVYTAIENNKVEIVRYQRGEVTQVREASLEEARASYRHLLSAGWKPY